MIKERLTMPDKNIMNYKSFKRKEHMVKNSLLVIALLLFSGCYQHNITMGKGAHLKDSVVDEIEMRHWYGLWGNLDVSAVDIDAFVKRNPDCDINIESKFVDFLLGIFIGPFSFGSRTITFEVPVDKNSARGRAIIERQRKEALKKAMEKEAERNKNE